MQYPHFDPVAVAIGPLKIHWYGLMYLVGIGSAWWLALRRSRRPDSPFNEQQVGDLIFWAALGVILGGRTGYVLFYGFDKFLDNPLWAFKIWEGGMSFHGGLLGVILAMWLYGRKLNLPFFRVADFVAPLVPIGLGAGRIGNFINGELWGRVAGPDVPWAMVFPGAINEDAEQALAHPQWADLYHQLSGLPRHPSQLYQFALEGVALFVILWLFSAKPRPRMAISGLFLICYGCFRIFAEFFRQPDIQLGFLAWDWLTMGQLLSVPMVLFGGVLVVLAYRRNIYEPLRQEQLAEAVAGHGQSGKKGKKSSVK